MKNIILIIVFLLAGIIRFFGALCVIIGVLQRVWAALITSLFLGIIVTEQGQHGFLISWVGHQQGERIGYSYLVITLGLIVMISDGGKCRLLTLKIK